MEENDCYADDSDHVPPERSCVRGRRYEYDAVTDGNAGCADSCGRRIDDIGDTDGRHILCNRGGWQR